MNLWNQLFGSHAPAPAPAPVVKMDELTGDAATVALVALRQQAAVLEDEMVRAQAREADATREASISYKAFEALREMAQVYRTEGYELARRAGALRDTIRDMTK